MVHHIHRHVRHFLFPHESNNYRARSLHPPFLLFYVFLVLAFQFGSFMLRRVDPNILGYATDITIEKIFALVNAERAKAGVGPVVYAPELTAAAQKKASDMFARNYWAHVSPVGTTPWSFITGAGYQYLYAGENLAKSFNTADEVVAAWMNSPTHRANLLKSEYKEMGIAIHNGTLLGEETTLVVQEFGARGQVPVFAAAPAILSPTPVPFVGIVEEQAPTATIVPVSPTHAPVPIAPVASTGEAVSPTGGVLGMLPFRMNRTISLVMAEFLLVVLLIDGIYIWRHRTARVSGHSMAHALFFAALLAAMGTTGAGVIL